MFCTAISFKLGCSCVTELWNITKKDLLVQAVVDGMRRAGLIFQITGDPLSFKTQPFSRQGWIDRFGSQRTIHTGMQWATCDHPSLLTQNPIPRASRMWTLGDQSVANHAPAPLPRGSRVISCLHRSERLTFVVSWRKPSLFLRRSSLNFCNSVSNNRNVFFCSSWTKRKSWRILSVDLKNAAEHRSACDKENRFQTLWRATGSHVYMYLAMLVQRKDLSLKFHYFQGLHWVLFVFVSAEEHQFCLSVRKSFVHFLHLFFNCWKE